MESIFYVIIVFILIFFYLIKNNKEGYENNNQLEKNKHDFSEIVKNSNRIYSEYNYNNKPLLELSNKYNSYLMCKDLRIPTPELYYYGNYNNIKKNIFNKKAFVIKPLDNNSDNNFVLINNNNKLINLFNGKNIKKEELNNVFKNKEVFIEELIKNDDGEHTIPDAYKVYSFNGEIEFILHRSFKNNKYYSNCYDKDWSPIDIKVDDFPKGELQPRPRKYLQMLEYSKIMVGKVFSNVFVTLVFYFNNTDPVFDKVVTNPNKGQNVNNKRTQEFLNYLCKKNDLSL